MTHDATDETADATAGQTDDTKGSEPQWKRQRRLAAIFGDVLPATTGDERGHDGAGAQTSDSVGDTWLRAQVPPHHGG